jgi:class 3 adenylate cyclase
VARGDSSIRRISDSINPLDIDLGGRTSPDGAVTILFTDIEGSTEMLERLGDDAWIEVLRTHNRLVREVVARYDGNEVKSQGDGFMIAFASARMCLHCAIEMQRSLDAFGVEHPQEPPRVRAGLHSGFAIHEDSDYFGRSVILAARIADRARGGEILASKEVREYVGADPELRFLEGQELTLKGLSGRHTVYPVDWRRDARVASPLGRG